MIEKKSFKKVYIEITNCCNLHCSFCPETKRAKCFMEVSSFDKILKEVKEVTNLVALHVKGEPLMHPKLKEILDVAKRNNIAVTITTNATLLKDKKDTLCTSPAIRQLNLSLHSQEEKGKKMQGYLQEVWETTEEITKQTKIYLSYRLWNLENLEENEINKEILEFLERRYNIKDLFERAKTEEFIKLKERVFLNQDKRFRWPDMGNRVIAEKGTCYGLRNQIAILVNGDVVPCCLDQEGDMVLGNILKEPLDKILQSKKAKEIKKGFEENKLLEGLCKRCGYREKFCKI